ncbi:tetratricopeptide repeat protein [Candidatus Synechococcus spongiarum]|uniref:tetratricopeptide repeat protein n=1 Tax=Candidatus Synechococcus spongiarum TaxID=431041 RepID=UPI00047202F1|nr:tetratricopeptide repeat protein [Candidatus Synechococcus spongiarum]
MQRAIILLLRGVLFSGGYAGMFVLGWFVASDTPAEVASPAASPAGQQKVVNLQRKLNRLPDDPDLLLELITTQLQQGDLQAVYDHLQTLRQQHPQRWRFGLLAAELLRASGELAAAEQQTQRLLAVDPDNLSLLRLYCRILLERGEPARAEAMAEAAWQRIRSLENPGEQDTVDAVPYGLLLADVRRSRGDVDAADQLLEQMIDRSKRRRTDPRPLIAQAMLRQDNGDLEAAQQLLAEARQHGDSTTIQWLDILSRRWSLELTRAPMHAPPQIPGVPPALTTP